MLSLSAAIWPARVLMLVTLAWMSRFVWLRRSESWVSSEWKRHASDWALDNSD